MTQQLDLDLASARRARDKGVARTAVANSEWIISMVAEMRGYAAVHDEFTMEQFRYDCITRKLQGPSSHHAWGALALAAQAQGIITWTKRYVNASAKRTHAHPVKLWRRSA